MNGANYSMVFDVIYGGKNPLEGLFLDHNTYHLHQ